jgi:hypothetical protein
MLKLGQLAVLVMLNARLVVMMVVRKPGIRIRRIVINGIIASVLMLKLMKK